MLMPHAWASRMSGSASCMLSTISIDAKVKQLYPSLTILGTVRSSFSKRPGMPRSLSCRASG